MQAVILAGGYGTRLRPLTLTRPKPLLPVVNVPVVERIIRKLPADVTKVVLAVNYKYEMLREYFEANPVGKELVLVEEEQPLGTGGAIKNVEREVDGPFFVFNGDVLDSLDLEALRRTHRKGNATATLALWEVHDPRHFGVMEMAGDRIVRFVEKPETRDEAPSNLANAGTYLLEPEVFDFIESGKAVSVEREVFPALLRAEKKLLGHPFEGYWVDCGRPETYLKAHEVVLKAEGRKHAFGPGTEDHGTTVEEWATAGHGCRLGANTELTRSVLLDRVEVADNAVVRDSLLGEGVQLEEDAAVVECVVGDGAVIRKGVLLKSVNVEPGEVIGDNG